MKLDKGGKAEKLRRRRVLVVDDSLTVREVERRLLENRGYDVTLVDTVRELIEEAGG